MRDVGLAEDLAQEALVAALEQWPESGVPDSPGAWLMATADELVEAFAATLVARPQTQRTYERACRRFAVASWALPRPLQAPWVWAP